MSRFTLTFPPPVSTRVTYGHDEERGYYCTVFVGGMTVAEYDRRSPGYNGVKGLLICLVDTGVLWGDAVEEAIERLPEIESPCDLHSDQARLAAVVLDNLLSGE